MNAKGWGLLLLLALLWGSSFFFYKILVAVLPPVTVVLGRVGIAAVAMNLWLFSTGQRVPLSNGRWLRFMLLGFLNNVLPFILIAWGRLAFRAAWLQSSLPPRPSSWWQLRIGAPRTRSFPGPRSQESFSALRG